MSHFVNVFRWSSTGAVGRTEMFASGLAVAVPVLVGAIAGDISTGLAVSIGGLLVGAVRPGQDWRTQIAMIGTRIGPTFAAMAIGPVAVRFGSLGDCLVILLAGLATLLYGLGRQFASVLQRFVTVLIIASSVVVGSANPDGSALLILAGAIWSVVVSLAIGACARALQPIKSDPNASLGNLHIKQRGGQLLRSLKTLSGWQHAARLTICLAFAAALRWYWPDHHLNWISVTVVLLSRRGIELFPVRTTQRVVGTIVGVLAAGLLLILPMPAIALALSIGGLAALRPMLRERSYFAYSMVMTPLIMLAMDGGHLITLGILVDRVVGTLVGASLVILTNLIAHRAISHVS